MDDVQLVSALRAGDEAAFASLIERYHPGLVRLAKIYVDDPSVAEEVAQETWVAVLKGLDRFEGRSSLKTWIYSILTNRAKTRGQREGRTIPFSAFGNTDDEPADSVVDADRFQPPDHPWAGHWIESTMPNSWDDIPENHLLSIETGAMIQEAINGLPPAQREVITLRDVLEWTSEEVCNILELSETNQRVLLHRARSKVRRALEEYLDIE